MEDKFYNLALRFLSYRTRSEKEVRDRLQLKIQNSKVKTTTQNSKLIDSIIEKLKEKKFINDEEFARMFLENRLRFKPRSLRVIKLELRQKGIAQELIESGIKNQELGVESDLESAKKLVEKKMGRFRNPFGKLRIGMTRNEIYQKLGRYLASKGFNWDIIKKSIDGILDKGV